MNRINGMITTNLSRRNGTRRAGARLVALLKSSLESRLLFMNFPKVPHSNTGRRRYAVGLQWRIKVYGVNGGVI